MAIVGDRAYAAALRSDDPLGSDNGAVQVFAVDTIFAGGFGG